MEAILPGLQAGPRSPPLAQGGEATFAAIDLGTNNCRLLIARPNGRSFRVIDAFSRIVRLGEGLAGTVWQDGRPGSHSPARPHEKWRPRADCANESYVCVPAGKAAGPGGVLGFGSDENFETAPEQVAVMEAYAAAHPKACG